MGLKGDLMGYQFSIPCVEADEETDLWHEYKRTGNESLRNELITMYTPLVKYLAGRITIQTQPHVEFDDLVSYGILGLIDAIEKYNPKMGSKFKTYATIRIKGAIYDELRLLDWVPRSVRQKAKEVEEVYTSLERKLGRSATDEEVAKSMNITVEELNKITLEISRTSIVSLDDYKHLGKYGDNELCIIDTVENQVVTGPETELEMKETKRLLMEAVNKLSQRERELIAFYYYNELTLREIGEVLGVTESRVSQLHTKAIQHLRDHLSEKKSALSL
jgi:RNA polymerase sigma factor for flagellar operon FliA